MMSLATPVGCHALMQAPLCTHAEAAVWMQCRQRNIALLLLLLLSVDQFGLAAAWRSLSNLLAYSVRHGRHVDISAHG